MPNRFSSFARRIPIGVGWYRRGKGWSLVLAAGYVALVARGLHGQVEPAPAGGANGLDQQFFVSRQAGTLRFGKAAWSPDGRHLALADENLNGMYVYDTADRTCLKVTDAPSSGYAYNWSADGRRLGFKLLIASKSGGDPLQMPVVFDAERKELTALHPAVAKAGVPSFAADGRVAFTIDRELRVADGVGPEQAYSLGHYTNLAPISPDGRWAAYNDQNEQIWVLDVQNGQKKQVTAGGSAYFNPVWSPDSTRLVVSTVAGQLKSIDMQTGGMVDLGEGSWPSWSPDSGTVFYSKTDRVDGVRVTGSGVYCVRPDGTGKTLLTSQAGEYAAAGQVSPDGRKVTYVSLLDGQVYEAALSGGRSLQGPGGGAGGYTLDPRASVTGAAMTIQAWDGTMPSVESESASVVPTYELMTDVKVVGTVPYIHQVYDTPDDFNGNWACGATSAMMGIEYYGVLPYWDITCSTPYSHISHYGQYISRIYTFNGYTYNIGSPDPNGVIAYGGYGYIVRNNWADTKSYMRDYIINHGLSSSVDWSPTFAKLQAEVNNNNPFILLNSLTTAGHYITTIGYVTGQYTAIFNDPYGNKNNGYVNYYGAGAKYDWPGYSNGYSNLNTVWCFIYCRGTVQQPPTITQQPVNQIVRAGRTATFTVAASGSSPLSYQWQKNGSNITNGGHYSGCTTTMLTVSTCDSNDVASYRCYVSNAYGNATSNAATLTVTQPGDFDGDSDVDQEDFAVLQKCLGVTNAMGDPTCGPADLSGDNTIDYTDVLNFEGCRSGAEIPANINCIN